MPVLRLLSLFLLALAAAPGMVAAHPPAESAAVVVMYHRFGENGVPSTNIRLEQLDAHIAALTSGRYTVLPLAEVVDALRAGRPLPPRAVAITVDDAYASFVTEGWPRFRAAGLPVTWFVNTAAVGAGFPGAPTWDDVRRLRDEGVAIGAHSHAHPSMPTQTPAEQEADMDQSLAVFERELGLRPTLFAYPYGEADAAAMRLAEAKGFAAAFGQHSGVAWAGDGAFYLPRFALNERYGAPDRFARVIDALPLPATDIVPANPTLSRANPPVYGFTVSDPALNPAAIACYGPSGAVRTEVLGPRVEVRLPEALPPGRARINCTLPGPRDGQGTVRWHWRGTQFVVLPGR